MHNSFISFVFFFLFSLSAFSTNKCEYSFIPGHEASPEVLEYRESLRQFNKMTEAQLFSIGPRKLEDGRLEHISLSRILAFSEAILQKTHIVDASPEQTFFTRQASRKLGQRLKNSLEKKEFYPQLLAEDLAELLYESNYSSLNEKLKGRPTEIPSFESLRERNFTINLWTQNMSELLRDMGMKEKKMKWYRSMWNHFVRGSTSVALNSASLQVGVVSDAYSYRYLDINKFYETDEIFQLSIEDLRKRYYSRAAKLGEKAEVSTGVFTKVVHRTAVVFLAGVLITALPYELAYYGLKEDGRLELEDKLTDLSKASAMNWTEDDRVVLMEQMRVMSSSAIVYKIRQLEKEAEDKENTGIF